MMGCVGPHEGRELELMLSGVKPLSMFVEPLPSEFELFPEGDFDRAVDQGRLVKFVSLETLLPAPPGASGKVRRVLYALPEHSWRISACILVHQIYYSLEGWRPDFERVIGALLGYSQEDVEKFIEMRSR